MADALDSGSNDKQKSHVGSTPISRTNKRALR